MPICRPLTYKQLRVQDLKLAKSSQFFQINQVLPFAQVSQESGVFNAVISSTLKSSDAFIEFCKYQLKEQDYYFYSNLSQGDMTEQYASF